MECGTHTSGLEYHICAPPVLHRWGEPVDFDIRLVPSGSTNIRLGTAKFELREKMKLQATFDKRLISNVAESAVAKGERDLSGESNEFHVRFCLPHSLKICRQSVRESRIHISHSIYAEVDFEDEDGQLGQVRA